MKRFLLICGLLSALTGVYAQTQYASVLKVTGTANLKPRGSTSYNIPVKISMGISIGDAIKTEADGFVALIFSSDKSMLKLRKNTEIEIRDDLMTRTIKVSEGRMLAEITPGIKTSYRIETPTSVASVKGTKFWVVSQPGFGDKFYGIEGQVNVLNLITGLESTLQPGQMIASTINGDLINLPVDQEEIPKDVEETPQLPPQPGQPTPPTPTGEAQVMVPETMPTEQPTPETPEAGAEPTEKKAGKPLGMGLGLGSVTIDGKIYNQIALRPELKLGKLAVALDVAIYMDEAGNIRKNEWDEVSDYLDKIYYIRWGQQGDPFFAKLGALDNVTMGYGILLNGYSNTTEYPQVRKIGIHTGMQGDNLGWEAFIANTKEITGPGLLAGRVTYRPLKSLPFIVGGTVVSDVNQYKGLKDTDEDNVPDIFDAFPEKKFKTPSFFPGFSGTSVVNQKTYAYTGTGEVSLNGSKFTRDTDSDGIPDEIDYDIDGDGLTDNYPGDPTWNNDPNLTFAPEPFSTKDHIKSLSAVAVDVGMPLVNLKMFKLHLYGQAASFVPLKIKQYPDSTEFTPGWGIAAPGLKMNIIKFINLGIEYRLAGENFLYGFWDRTYDFERVLIRDSGGNLVPWTKDQMRLKTDPMQGIFGQLDVNILNYIILGGYYQHMFVKTTEVKSFMAMGMIPKGKIPKLADATVFYQRNNDPNPFDFKNPSENTILGYRIGFELGGGAVIYYKFQRTYRDSDGNGRIDPKTEAISLTTIETGFSF